MDCPAIAIRDRSEQPERRIALVLPVRAVARVVSAESRLRGPDLRTDEPAHHLRQPPLPESELRPRDRGTGRWSTRRPTPLLCASLPGSIRSAVHLPSVRALSADLGINPSTVQVVMARLQAVGFVEPRARVGMVVRDYHLYGGIETCRYVFRFSQQLPELATRIFADVLTTRVDLVLGAVRAIAGDPRRYAPRTGAARGQAARPAHRDRSRRRGGHRALGTARPTTARGRHPELRRPRGLQFGDRTSCWTSRTSCGRSTRTPTCTPRSGMASSTAGKLPSSTSPRSSSSQPWCTSWDKHIVERFRAFVGDAAAARR